ncbi:MAG: hypothetical protein D6790_07420 [Caldilineae bacterium]|nr:MAG: hypothetical protein D6790_07420 [Caldilineae bacterium]
MTGPYQFDPATGLVYANGQLPEGPRVIAWDPEEAGIVRMFPAGGPFVVDPADHQLLIDNPNLGLDVFDLTTNELLTHVALPQIESPPSPPPPPLFDPIGGVVYVFRGSQVLGVDVLRHRVIRSMDTQERIADSDLLPIAQAAFDPVRRLLYLVYTYQSAAGEISSSLLAVDAARAWARGRQIFPHVHPADLLLAPRNGRLYVLAIQASAPTSTATLTRWENGFPSTVSRDLPGPLPRSLVVDGVQDVLYAAGPDATYILHAQTLELLSAGPGGPGPFVALDQEREGLIYLDPQGRPQVWPLANIQPNQP